jgi:hypothetical protein
MVLKIPIPLSCRAYEEKMHIISKTKENTIYGLVNNAGYVEP